MPRNGLTGERVVQAAALLVEQKGAADFSMRALAESLNVKTASLYNHVQSMDALLSDVCAYTLRLQYDGEMAAIGGKSGAEAIAALAGAYRDFARDHRQLYRLSVSRASCADPGSPTARYITEPFMKVLEQRALSDEEKCHWQRVLRGIVHGFVSQEDAGFFSHLPAAVDESFRTAIRCYTDGLAQAEGRERP